MKIATYFSLFILTLIGSTLFLFSHHKNKQLISQQTLTAPGGAMSAEGGDDVNARNNYELMRLRDPQTGQIPYHVRELELAFAHTLPNDEMASSSTSTAFW